MPVFIFKALSPTAITNPCDGSPEAFPPLLRARRHTTMFIRQYASVLEPEGRRAVLELERELAEIATERRHVGGLAWVGCAVDQLRAERELCVVADSAMRRARGLGRIGAMVMYQWDVAIEKDWPQISKEYHKLCEQLCLAGAAEMAMDAE